MHSRHSTMHNRHRNMHNRHNKHAEPTQQNASELPRPLRFKPWKIWKKPDLVTYKNEHIVARLALDLRTAEAETRIAGTANAQQTQQNA